jgi:hypothetical protein
LPKTPSPVGLAGVALCAIVVKPLASGTCEPLLTAAASARSTTIACSF